MEDLIIFANFSFWMYACGINYLSGCRAQIVEEIPVVRQTNGEFSFHICYFCEQV